MIRMKTVKDKNENAIERHQNQMIMNKYITEEKSKRKE